jgi:hypothetical protein
MGKRVLRIAVGAAALLVSSVWAQQNVGIGTNTPHPTALLELYSTSKGLLIPRMTQAERDAISSPATGLLIYQTDNTPGFYYWNGTAWIPILSSSSGSGPFWSLTGNSITGTEFLGTTNAQPLVIRVGNQETLRFNPPGASAPAWSIQRGGGNQRGLHAVDLQSARSAATQVASGDYSVIGGGEGNTASGDAATVGGGYANTASGRGATVGGGISNTASGDAATVGGGISNTASGDLATVGGGGGNTASGVNATVGGGDANTASGSFATVGGGISNTASGSFATVGGGSGNTASGNFSAIPGGFYLRVGDRSFGFSGQTSTTQTDLSANSNIAAFVDVDLWLYSRDRTQASQLRFYEAQAHISGANYVALQAPTSLSANTTYTLPASDGSPGQVLTTDGNGQLSWNWIWGAGEGMIFVRKTANESVTNSTTPQADDHLYATLPANSIWEVEILLRTQSAGPDNSNGGIRVQLNAPTGTTLQVFVEIKKGGSGDNLLHDWYYGWISAPNTSVGYNPIPGPTPMGAVKIKGWVIVGSTGGTLQLYWAQNTASTYATTVYANSYMRLTRMQ